MNTVARKSLLLLVASLLLAIAITPQAVAANTVGPNELASVSTLGVKGNDTSVEPRVSGNGIYIVFSSDAENLVSGDTNSNRDVFLHSRATGRTTMVSHSTGASQEPSISADGRYVVFRSGGNDLIGTGADTNGCIDIFLFDRETGTTRLVSRATDGTQSNANSYAPQISADGSTVTYYSQATNLDAEVIDAGSDIDVFVFTVATGETKLISRSTDDVNAANGDSISPSLSSDGSSVVYQSYATDLHGLDTDADSDIVITDVATGTTELASLNTAGDGSGNSSSYSPSLSDDGTKVVFYSLASDLVSSDSYGGDDVFVRDLTAGVTELASVSSDGTQSNAPSYFPSISPDGKVVLFSSSARNLVADDDSIGYAVYARHIELDETIRVSQSDEGAGQDDNSHLDGPGMLSALTSGNERIATFFTGATNLLTTDGDSTFDSISTPIWFENEPSDSSTTVDSGTDSPATDGGAVESDSGASSDTTSGSEETVGSDSSSSNATETTVSAAATSTVASKPFTVRLSFNRYVRYTNGGLRRLRFLIRGTHAFSVAKGASVQAKMKGKWVKVAWLSKRFTTTKANRNVRAYLKLTKRGRKIIRTLGKAKPLKVRIVKFVATSSSSGERKKVTNRSQRLWRTRRAATKKRSKH